MPGHRALSPTTALVKKRMRPSLPILAALTGYVLLAETLQLGQFNEKVTSASNPDQSYVLYLPSNYSEARKWPVVFVFDPGARALTTCELFRQGAEKYGYVVFCS